MPAGTSQATVSYSETCNSLSTQNQRPTSLMTPNSSGVAAAPVLTPLGGMSGTFSEIKTATQAQDRETKRTNSLQNVCGNSHLPNGPKGTLAVVTESLARVQHANRNSSLCNLLMLTSEDSRIHPYHICSAFQVRLNPIAPSLF